MFRNTSELAIAPKYQRKIEKAEREHKNMFFEKMVCPILYDPDQNIHVPHFCNKKGNFSQADTEKLITLASEYHDDMDAFQCGAQLFTNPLGFATFDRSKKTRGTSSGYTPPTDRITNAGFMVFTFEHDGADAASLEMQLDWFMGKPDDCPFAKVHKQLSTFADYRGYLVVFSGHKSLHIHILFDIHHLSKKLAKERKGALKHWTMDVPDNALGELYRRKWSELHPMLCNGLDADIIFDRALSTYSFKRRSPWGFRIIDKEDNIHGFNIGDKISQTVIQERILPRSPNGATSVFMSADSAKMVINQQRGAQNRPSMHPVCADTNDELLMKFKDYLRANGHDEYPSPEILEYREPYNYFFFKNDAGDINPSTMVRGDCNRLMGAGKNAPKETISLPHGLSLDETISILEQGIQTENPSRASSTPARKARPAKPSKQFANSATNMTTARDLLNKYLRNLPLLGGVTLVAAPEGIGKTYSLMNSIQERRWDLDADRYHNGNSLTRGFIVFASRSYGQASSKREEYLRLENGSSTAILLKSFSKLYEQACEYIETTQLTREDVGGLGYSNMLEAISYEQPDVYKKLCELRNEMWPRTKNGNFIVPHGAMIFTSQQLVKSWPHSHTSKAFLHPDFPDDFDKGKIDECKKAMLFYQVVYDEVGWADFVSMDHPDAVSLAKDVEAQLRTGTSSAWDETSLASQVLAYNQVKLKKPNSKLSFDKCNQIIRMKYNNTDDLGTVHAKKYPFGKGDEYHNIYSLCDGNKHYCKELRWLDGLGCSVIILTTEDLPKQMFAAICRKENKTYRYLDFTLTPYLFNDAVPVTFDESARSPRDEDVTNKLSCVDLATKLLNNEADFVISNSLTKIDDSLKAKVSTHETAKGRNDLSDKNIATIISYPAVEQYEHYTILGAKFNIDDPVAVAFRDLVFQNLGRNLGFRYSGDGTTDVHKIYIKPSLYRDLKGFLGAPDDRYQFYLSKG